MLFTSIRSNSQTFKGRRGKLKEVSDRTRNIRQATALPRATGNFQATNEFIFKPKAS